MANDKISGYSNKKIHLEIIRVFAILLVLFQHSDTCGNLLYFKTQNRFVYVISLFLGLFSKIAVPLFFMISGALLLKKDEPVKVIFKKRILRMVVVLTVFSAFYYIYLSLIKSKPVSVSDFFLNFIQGKISTPLWYLYSYISLLILLPFLRFIVKNMRFEHYIYLFLLNFTFVTAYSVIRYFITKVPYTSDFSLPIATERNFFYFIMGYFFEHKLPEKYNTKKTAVILPVFGLLFVTTACILTHIICLRDGYSFDKSTVLYQSFISLPTFSVYFGIKYLTENVKIPDKAKKIICFLASNVFGIYLFECFFRNILRFIYNKLYPSITALPACFIWLFCVFIAGEILVSILRLIPFVKKYI